MKRLKRDNPNLTLALEDDVRLMFFSDLEGSTRPMEGDFNLKLKSFSDSVNRKF